MDVDIQIQGRFLPPNLADKIRAQLPKTIKDELNNARAEIYQRTQSGKSIEGSSFVPYTNKYAALKGSGTIFLNRSGYQSSRQTSPPDLTLTGRMLGAMQVRTSGTGGEIYFTGDQEPKARGNQVRRPFFGLSRKQVDIMGANIATAIVKLFGDNV